MAHMIVTGGYGDWGYHKPPHYWSLLKPAQPETLDLKPGSEPRPCWALLNQALSKIMYSFRGGYNILSRGRV